jgi:hypothetical protein
MTNVNDNVRISDNIGVVASSSSKQLSSIRTLSLPFFILNILLLVSWILNTKKSLFSRSTLNILHIAYYILHLKRNLKFVAPFLNFTARFHFSWNGCTTTYKKIYLSFRGAVKIRHILLIFF